MDFKNLIKSVAPVLGAALGGPLGGMAANAIGEALSLSNPTQEAIKSLMGNGGTPEQLLAIKNAENDFALKMQSLGFAHAEAITKLNAQMSSDAVNDRISARAMQTALQTGIVPAMAILVTVGFFSILFFMLFYPVPPDNKDVLNSVIGSLGTAWIMVISFYFGTSLGSQSKDALLARVRQVAR